jgi:hypothetical protein
MSWGIFTLWFGSYLGFGMSARRFHPLLKPLFEHLSTSRVIDELRLAAARLKRIQELLESGLVPDSMEWDQIKDFPEPWNRIVSDSLLELRNQGAPVLPTLTRVQRTLTEQVDFVLEAKTKSAQALSQALLSLLLVPGFGAFLFLMLPGLKQARTEFFVLLFFSTLISSGAFLWILALSDRARFGNVRSENRRWWVSVHAAIEKIFALISAGHPPDQAWRVTILELASSDPSLARAWGSQVWDRFEQSADSAEGECERLMVSLGVEVRRSIQTSLIEGRGCLDRMESIHRSFLSEVKLKVQHELNLLPNRCLMPLFVCVFPSVVLLLGGSLWLFFQEMG